MAEGGEQYDGRVVIGTELDNSGFEKGSEKLKASVSGLAQAIASISGTLGKAFGEQIKVPEPELPEKDDLELPEPDPIKPEVDTTALDAGVQKIHEDMERIVNDVGADLPEPEPIEPTLESAQFDKQVGKLQTSVGRIVGDINRMVSTSTQGFRSTTSVLAFNNKLDLTAEKIADAREQLAEFAEQEIPTDQYAETTASIQKAEAALLKLYDRRDQMADLGVDENSKQWQKLELQITAAEEEVERYEMAADRMRETGQAFIDPTTTEQYAAMVEEIERAEQALSTNAGLIKQEELEQARLNVLAAQEGVAHASTERQREAAMQKLQEAQNALAAVAQDSVTPAPDPVVMSTWQKFGATIKGSIAGAASKIKNFGHGVRTAAAGLVGYAKDAKGFFSNLGKKGASSVDGIVKKLTGLKNMLMSRIKRTFISSIFNSVKESFNELAKFDSRFDQSVSNFKNRSAELGANIMASVGGIIRQVEPIITRVIDAASTAVTKLNAVLTSIRGESVMQVAVRRTDSYADSLRDAGKAAKEDQKAQEALNETLTSIDEIHKLDAPKDNTSAADTGADAEKLIYENVPVNSILGSMGDFGRNISQRIIDGIRNGNWGDAGRAISEGLNAAVSAIDGKLLAARPKAEKAAESVADLLNGMVEEFNGYALGKTLADGLNLALGTANAFLKRFDFYEFGATIGDGITGAVQNFEWETAGETLGNSINGFVNTARGIIEHTDWNALGGGFGRGLSSLIETVDFANIAQTLSEGLIGLLDTFSSFMEEMDWQAFGAKVYEFFTNVDWGGILSALARGAGAVLGGIAGFVWGLIKRAMDSVKDWWYENAYENGEFSIGGLLAGIGHALINLGQWILDNVWSPFRDSIRKAFGLDDEDAEMIRFGEEWVAGLFDGIAKALADVYIWIYDNVWVPIRDAVKGAFGIHSPSKQMATLGGFISDGLLEGIKAPLKNIYKWIKNNIFTPIFNGIKSAFGIVSGAAGKMLEIGKMIIEGLFEGIKDKMSGVKDWLNEHVTGKLVNKFKDLLGIHSPSTIFKKLGGFLTEGFENGLTEGWRAITGFFEKKIKDFDAAGRQMTESLKQGVSAAWDSLVGDIMGKMQNLTSWLEGGLFKQAGANMVYSIADGIGSAWNGLVGDIWGKVGNLQAWFTDSLFYGAGVNIVQGLINGIENNWYNVDGVCETLANGTVNLVQSIFGIHSPSKVMAEIGGYLTEGLANGIDDGQREVLNTARDLSRSVIAEMDKDAGLTVSADGMITGLDAVADKLAAIARIFTDIGHAFPDMSAVPVPAVALGALAPAQTRVTDDSKSDSITATLIERLIGRIEELEEAVANRPIRVESKLMLEQREIAKATTEYNASASRVTNGNGGANRW